MTKHKSFTNDKFKFPKLWNSIHQNLDNIKQLDPIKIIEVPLTTLKKTSRFALDTNPIFYDLYDFQGITYIAGVSKPPIIESCYTENPSGTWHFILPIRDFRVLAGNDPEDVSGCPDWKFQSSIGSINQILRFTLLSESDIHSFQLLSYLFDENGETVQNQEFSEFYRWVEQENGYDFHYNAIFDVPENSQLFLKAELVLVNKRDYSGIQHTKIKD